MKRASYLILSFAILANTTASYAFQQSDVVFTGGGSSYIGGKKKLSPCSLNFIKLLDGKIPATVMGQADTGLWSDAFNARSYLDDIMDTQGFDQAAKRVQYLEDLSKFTHKDEIFVRNVSELANLMEKKGMVSADDLKRIFIKRDFSYAKFTWSHRENKMLASLNIDPAKASAIDGMISQAQLGKEIGREYRQILRNSEVTYRDLKFASQYGMTLKGDAASLERFRQYIEFLDGYAGKKFGRAKIRTGLKHIEDIYGDYNPKWYDVSKWFRPHKKFLAQTPETLNRQSAIESFIKEQNGLSRELKEKYRAALERSGLSQEEIEFAQKQGIVLRDDLKSFERFQEYLVYMDYLPGFRVKKALKNSWKIYTYADDVKFYIPSEILPPHKQFMAQRRKVMKYEAKQADILERDYKMQKVKELTDELDEILEAKRAGKYFDEDRIAQIKKEIDGVELSKAQRKSIRGQAKAKASIFRRLMNGCNGGGSARLASAKRKFKRLKLALAIGGTPTFYLMKNWDKKDEDPYFWERLGQEMAMGLFFTLIANKIVTNTDKSFWGRYLEGYVKFSALDILSAGSYDLLFGEKAYIRYFQQIYNGGVLTPTRAEEELEKLRASPTFEEDVKEMMAYMEEMAKKKNFKNILDKHFNLSAYSSLDDEFKITQEDLESEEAREVMLELMAEKIYLENMGDWPVFQTGNRGLDRWTFYRGRNVLTDLKGMALNIAMFEIMCRQPLGKIGSWGLILGLVMGDWMYSGKLTSSMRREAINQ